MSFRDSLTRAGLSVNEGVKIIGISRPTFYNWEKGVTPRVPIQYRAVTHACLLLDKAVAAGRLPLMDRTMSAKERVAAVRRIIKEVAADQNRGGA